MTSSTTIVIKLADNGQSGRFRDSAHTALGLQTELQFDDGVLELLRCGRRVNAETPGGANEVTVEFYLGTSRPYYQIYLDWFAGIGCVRIADGDSRGSHRLEMKKADCDHVVACVSAHRSELLVLQSIWPTELGEAGLFQRFRKGELRHFLTKIMQWPRENFIKYMKYHTVCPMAYLLGQELPPKPDGFEGHWLVWPGSVKQFLKNHLNVRRPHGTSLKLAWGLLQGVKRGCAVVSDEFVLNELKSHAGALGKPPLPTSEADHNELSMMVGTVLDACKVTKYRNDDVEPSHAACYELPRSKGGAYNAVVGGARLDWSTEPARGVFYEYPELGRYSGPIVSGDLFTPMDAARCRCAVETHNLAAVLFGACGTEDMMNTAFDHELIEIMFSGLHGPAVLAPWTGNRSRVVPILEPLKVRTITATNGLASFVAKNCQRAMKSTLDSLKANVLTTGPLCTMDLHDLYEREQFLFKTADLSWSSPPQWVSGDYKGATDTIKLPLTKMAFEQFLTRIQVPDTDVETLRMVLYEQVLEYPKKCGIAPVQQQTGQLMGSVESFPILLLLNLAGYLLAFRDRFRSDFDDMEADALKHLVRTAPVLVNGDDILFRADDELYSHWMRWIGVIGFVLSVGKNYRHPSVLTVNSQCFVFSLCDNVPRFERVPYLNVGLLIGQAKVAGGRTDETKPLWSIFNQLVDECPDPSQMARHFIHYNRERIQELTKKGLLNLFLPTELGGLGFRSTTSDGREFHPVKLTNLQQAYASNIVAETLLKDGKPDLYKKIPKLKQAAFSLKTSRYAEPVVFNKGLGCWAPIIGPHLRGSYPTDFSPGLGLPLTDQSLDRETPRYNLPQLHKLVKARVHPLPVPVLLDYAAQYCFRTLECYQPRAGSLTDLTLLTPSVRTGPNGNAAVDWSMLEGYSYTNGSVPMPVRKGKRKNRFNGKRDGQVETHKAVGNKDSCRPKEEEEGEGCRNQLWGGWWTWWSDQGKDSVVITQRGKDDLSGSGYTTVRAGAHRSVQ